MSLARGTTGGEATASSADGVLAARLYDFWLTYYRRTWRGSVISSFLTPLLYVLAMGVLLGGFIEGDPDRLDGATSYLAFVGPGLLAAQIMLTAFQDMSWPVMGKIKWERGYYAMIATPLRVRDVVVGHLAFCLFRVAVVSGVFVVVLLPFGIFATWWGPLLAFLVQLPLGLAFAAAVYTVTVRTLSEAAMGAMFRLVMMPLFLFSGAFFPVENLPTAMEWLARVTPLWQGVSLTRMASTGHAELLPALGHLAYLLAMCALCVWLAVRALERRLLA